MYTDLATIFNLTDVNNLNALVSNSVRRAWIGLEIGDEYTWHWSWPDQILDFLNWKAGEPQNNNSDACATMDQHGEWFESVCTTRRSFVCQSKLNAIPHLKLFQVVIVIFKRALIMYFLIFEHVGNGDSPRLVAETKSWRDAQKHCRDLSSELVSIHSAEENEAVRNVSGSQNVWIGLFKDAWKWSDGSNSSFRFWKSSQPNYQEGQDCAAAIFNDQGRWNDLRCVTKRSFVCRGGKLLCHTPPLSAKLSVTL